MKDKKKCSIFKCLITFSGILSYSNCEKEKKKERKKVRGKKGGRER
jgi:hypothetical protein